jgi:hypothetical protein
MIRNAVQQEKRGRPGHWQNRSRAGARHSSPFITEWIVDKDKRPGKFQAAFEHHMGYTYLLLGVNRTVVGASADIRMR